MGQDKKIVATIEARMNSNRLPGKVLMEINGIASLKCQIIRLQQSSLIDEIVIATTTNKKDDLIEEFSNLVGCNVYRGDEEDVMNRILLASESRNADIQVQLTGDCPLVDPMIIDNLLSIFIKDKQFDLISNSIERSYPIGLDCRIFYVSSLRKAEQLCDDPIHRVHGSTFLYAEENKDIFSTKNFYAPESLFYPEWRWTLDTLEDFSFLEEIFKFFKEDIFVVSSQEIADFLNSNPEVLQLNKDVRQKTIEEG